MAAAWHPFREPVHIKFFRSDEGESKTDRRGNKLQKGGESPFG
jgi:hypothetical protein